MQVLVYSQNKYISFGNAKQLTDVTDFLLQAIERFQRNLQSLDDRMNELQPTFTRTRLSSSVQEMEQILESQEEMWHDVKEDIESARQAGVTLLDCITVHPNRGESRENVLTPDVEANAAELKEALTELEDSENKFEKFWKNHKLKIQYGLKVCLFEREMSQVSCWWLKPVFHRILFSLILLFQSTVSL